LADHEGSSYSSLVKAKRRHRDYITRTKRDRAIVEGNGKLLDYLSEQPPAACWSLEGDEETEHRGRGASRRRRWVVVELHFADVTLVPNHNYRGRSYRKGLPVSAVYVHEPKPPAGCAPLLWMLLCIEPIRTKHNAQEAVLDYRCRWGAEDI